MGRTIHIGIGGKPIDISDSEAEALIKVGVLYECGDGHDLHIDPDASADLEDLELLLIGIIQAASAEPINLDDSAPAGGEVKGLPVAGYKLTQPDWALALVNENKILEERVLRQIEKHGAASTDGRWVSIGKTQIEQGFMALNRAVFQPGRVTLPEDEA